MRNTHLGFIFPGQPIPDGIPANFELMQKALNLAEEGGNADRKHPWKSDYLNEPSYKAYFDDMVENERDWMEVRVLIFSNIIFALRLCI